MTEENKAIAIRENHEAEIISALPSGSEMQNMMQWSEMMGQTPFYKQMVSGGGKYGILAIFAAARELGIPAFQALNGGLWIVNGRVTLSAQMMGLLIRKRGHMITKKVGTDKICHLVGKRADTGEECEMIFTIEQAERAGLLKNAVWKIYAPVMLYNRCLSMLAKQLFQDAIGNAVVEGEVDNVIDVTPEQEEPLDRDSMLFIDTFDLIDLESPASKFIDSISTNLGQDRKETIRQCAQDADKFQKNLDRFIKKTSAKLEKGAK